MLVEKDEAVVSWAAPESVFDIHVFICFAKFSAAAVSITELTKCHLKLCVPGINKQTPL